MMLAEIKEVALREPDLERLWGCYVDIPVAGTTSEASALDLTGWVLGKSSPAVAIEILENEKVTGRIPFNHKRPDIAKAFPKVAGAQNSGFRTTISALGTDEHFELALQAVLKDQSRVPIGVIRGKRRWESGSARRGSEMALVSVVIPCYNQARFLGEAIEGVLEQSYPHFEVVVIDDGSTDNTSEVASRYPGVRCIRQHNRGLAGARNEGIRRTIGDYLVFLDADDRLLPCALEVGLRELEAHPECAFVSGHCRFIGVDGSPLPTPDPTPVDNDKYLTLLLNTYIWMPATVMYRRAVFETVGVFDATVGPSADYDLYLRVTREYPVHHHGVPIAGYRQHDANMTGDPARMLAACATTLRRQRPYTRVSRRYREAYEHGMVFWRNLYGEPLVDEIRTHLEAGEWRQAWRGLAVLRRHYPRGFVRASLDLRSLHRYVRHKLGARQRRRALPDPGRIRFGNLRRVTPVSEVFGYDRGQPIDRYYIENFLAFHAKDIRGHVLEIGDDTYTRRFGGDRVTNKDVLHVSEGNPSATIVADLTHADRIPSDTFDCIIFTQTLHLIYDTRAAILTLHRILKPGGILLATFPGISQIARDQWGDSWYWAFTALSARRMFEEVFRAQDLKIEAHGNVLAALSFLHGLAVRELRKEELDHRDSHYEVLITLRAVKQEEPDEALQA